MTRNLGDADRAARIMIGAVIGVPFLGRGLGRGIVGTTGVVLGAVAVYFLATGLVGWCPFYAITRASTRSAKDAGATLQRD